MPYKRVHPKYERITSKWGNMKLRIEMGVRIENWLNIFADDSKETLLKLLSSFYYYDEKQVKEKAKSLFKIYLEQFEGDLSNVIFTKTLNDYTASHSDVFFSHFWLTNEIYNNSVDDIIPLIEKQVPKTLVIVDDFSGSGLSLMSTIDRILETNNNAKSIEFCFLVLHVTELAMKNLDNYSKAVGIDLKVFPLEGSKKAFAKDYVFPADIVESKKKEYSEIYDTYIPKGKLKFGFHNVSSLVTFYYNTPNNTLGLFWQDIDDNNALFKRDTRNRNTQLNQLIKSTTERKSIRTISIYGIEEKRIQIMLEYCVEFGKDFSVLEFEEAFDLVSGQANAILKSFILKGYLINNGNEFKPTKLLKSKMFITRLKGKWKEEKKKSREYFDTHEEYIPVNFGKEK